jgi:Arc/MetJ-type ribon-helix-helix transcriptional regulator
MPFSSCTGCSGNGGSRFSRYLFIRCATIRHTRLQKMTSRTARLNIRIPEEDLRELEAARERAGKETVSDVAREAIASYLHDESASWNSEKITTMLPAALVEDVEMFVASGDAGDMTMAITLALTAWVEEKKRYYLEGRDALRGKLAEAVEDRGTRKGMARTASRMRVQ